MRDRPEARSMRPLQTSLLVLVCLALVALGGCGGDNSSKDSSTQASTDSTEPSTASTDSSPSGGQAGQYGADLRQILSDFTASFQASAGALQQAKSVPDAAGNLTAMENSLQTAADSIKALEPPAAAQAGQDQLVSALEGFSSRLSPITTAAASGDNQAANSAANDLQPALSAFESEFSAAVQALGDAGVPLPPPPAPTG